MLGIVNERHESIRCEVRETLERIVLPIRDKIEEDENVPFEIIEEMGHRGWYGLSIPNEYGGRGAGHLARVIAIEEASRISGAVGGALQSAILGTAMFQYFCNSTQKEKWLPKLAKGSEIASICVTEPFSGSHVLGMKTNAERNGNHYVLNGKNVGLPIPTWRLCMAS